MIKLKHKNVHSFKLIKKIQTCLCYLGTTMQVQKERNMSRILNNVVVIYTISIRPLANTCMFCWHCECRLPSICVIQIQCSILSTEVGNYVQVLGGSTQNKLINIYFTQNISFLKISSLNAMHFVCCLFETAHK